MLTYLYERELAVAPFFIVPVAVANDEAAVVLGPRRPTVQNGEMVRQLYGLITEQNLSSVVIAQILPFDGLILISNTIQTNVPDKQSGRHGLKLTYGALIKRDVFFECADVCTKVFNFFDEFFQRAFGASTSIEGAERVVEYFQRTDKHADEFINAAEVDDFLDQIEREFNARHKRLYYLARKLSLSNRRLFRKSRLLKPVPTVEKAARFWRTIDEGFYAKKQGAPRGERWKWQFDRPVTRLIFGSLLSLVLSIGFVELLGQGGRPHSMWIALAQFCIFLYSYVVPIILITYALKRSLSQGPKKQILLTIVISYFSLILVFAGIYYSMEAVSDYNNSVREYLHYHYEGEILNQGLAVRIRPFSEDQRALKGVESRFWTGVEDVDLWEVYRDPDGSLEKYWVRNAQRPLKTVVRFQPAARLPVFADCLHFSVMTMTTVGYGDITPRAWYAKLASDLQAIAGVILIVIALGLLFGNWHGDSGSTERGHDHNEQGVLEGVKSDLDGRQE